MSNATCKLCGKNVSWRATRGSRLADLRCSCGGQLTAARTGAYGGPDVVRSGYKFAKCFFCGRRVKTTAEIAATGKVKCWWHSREYPDRPHTSESWLELWRRYDAL